MRKVLYFLSLILLGFVCLFSFALCQVYLIDEYEGIWVTNILAIAYIRIFFKIFAALNFIGIFTWGKRKLHRHIIFLPSIKGEREKKEENDSIRINIALPTPPPSTSKDTIGLKKNKERRQVFRSIGTAMSRFFSGTRVKMNSICNMKKIITILLAVYLCALGFLFAINGRYTALEDVNGYHLVFDKWSKKVLHIYTWHETKDYEKK